MKIRKAVITAASPGQRNLPLQQLVDIDGRRKTALHIIADEAVAAGVEEIAVVVCPGDESRYAEGLSEHEKRLFFIAQDNPRGYGDALLRARDFTEGQSFLHLVSDHLYLSRSIKRCAIQVVEAATEAGCALLALQTTRESMLPYYGAIGGRRVEGQRHLYEIEKVLEKPSPTRAEQELLVPGLRAGFYLCLFGVHVLSPLVMSLLAEDLAQGSGKVDLSTALTRLAQRERVLGLEVQGKRYDIEPKYGLLLCQLAFSLAGSDRDFILREMVELLAADSNQVPRASA